MALNRLQPASIRLIDNEQFAFGHALAPAKESFFASVIDSIKTFYVTTIKGFDPKKLAVTTLLFEGDAATVKVHEAKVLALAAKYGGLTGGEENGKRGYLLTFVIAYLRDIAFDYHYVAESFETSCPLSCIKDLCRNVSLERLSPLPVLAKQTAGQLFLLKTDHRVTMLSPKILLCCSLYKTRACETRARARAHYTQCMSVG